MSLTGNSRGANALSAILDMRGKFDRISDKDLDGVVIVLAKKQMIAAGQTLEDMKALQAVIGDELFEATLKTLSPYHTKLLAKRIDKEVDVLEISTGPSAAAHVRKLMKGEVDIAAPEEDEIEAASEDTPAETPKKNAYFGRRSFRTDS